MAPTHTCVRLPALLKCPHCLPMYGQCQNDHRARPATVLYCLLPPVPWLNTGLDYHRVRLVPEEGRALEWPRRLHQVVTGAALTTPETSRPSVPTTYLGVDSLPHGDSGTFQGKLFDTEVTALERGRR